LQSWLQVERIKQANGIDGKISMSSTDQKHIDRKASNASILRFVDTAVLPERGSRDKPLCHDAVER